MKNIEPFADQFQSLIDQHQMVGLSLAIVHGSDIIYSSGLGVTGVEDYSLPITSDTLFAIGSITKTLAASTIMRLVEQNILDLDRPIIEYLDGFNFEDVINGQHVTLRHLLSHSSGLPAAGRYWGHRGHDALRTFVYDDIRYHQFFTPPGTTYTYSNTAISCVAYVAEVVTGTPFDRLVQQLIFDPLNMHRSTFNLSEAMTYPSALPHYRGEDDKLHVIHRQPDNDMGHASSFCYCSTHDLATFASALLMPEKLFDTRTLQEMQTPMISLHVNGANYPGALMLSAYGLGLELGEYRGCRLVGHGGRNQSFNCFLKLFPDQQIAVVLQTNYMEDETGLNILFGLFDELLEPTAPLRPSEPKSIFDSSHEIYTGQYLNPTKGILTISVQNDDLVLNEQHPLVCIGEAQYIYRMGILQFPVVFPYQDIVVVWGIPYHRIRSPHVEPDLKRWADWVGVFIDPFTPYPEETAIDVRLNDGQLWINNVPQQPLSNYRFVSSIGLYEFLSNDQLQVQMGTRYVRVSDTSK